MTKPRVLVLLIAAGLLISAGNPGAPTAPKVPLGLPELAGPAPGADKIALGKKLFEDKRFSSTGEVSCATCHDAAKAFTDSPLSVSEGIRKLTGTRNAPTVINAAYFEKVFWDGRSPSLEDQALHPFVNPVEMGLKDHEPILAVVRDDPAYARAFQSVFGKSGKAVTMAEVTGAIAAFERTIISGDSPFDRYYFRGEENALTPAQKRGFQVFVNEGRCVSCHVVEQTQAVFTDNRFHNVGVGINAIQSEVPALATEFIKARIAASEVDVKVLTDKRTSELGRLAVTRSFDDIGSFKTPTLRNVALTAPYMHDGSLKTLKLVVEHYNNGGITTPKERINDFVSGGIRPLKLTPAEINDLVVFLDALTSPEVAKAAKAKGK